MTPDDFASLQDITEAAYRAEAAQMQQLLQEESRLRAALARLDAQHAATRAMPSGDLDGLRQIGGDILWQGWVGRQRAELQSTLARVLARKERMIRKLRRAFGKARAVEQTAAATRAHRVRADRAKDADQLAYLAVLARWNSGG